MPEMIRLRGKLTDINPEDARRISVYLVRGQNVLAHAPVQEDGQVSLSLARILLKTRSAYDIDVVVGPAGLQDEHLREAPKLQRVPLKIEEIDQGRYLLPLEELVITEELLKIWWLWCRLYCVKGVVMGPDGCPVPGAQVTVHTVTYSGGAYNKAARATVITDENGEFEACFNWCSWRFCWPCWPSWWLCWPWWWEHDILHIIDQIERKIPLRQPDARQLIRGEAFAPDQFISRNPGQDVKRTALIEGKLSDPIIRTHFPWWWWCCDDPNIVFSVTQGANTIIDEDPATQTRWCLEDDSFVVLVGNEETVGVCPVDPAPSEGFVWTRVGNTTLDKITDGYADGTPGTDRSDMAFAGTLDIFGEFAPASGVAYYQVDAGQWTGNPVRGGTPPMSSTSLSAELWNKVTILHRNSSGLITGTTHANIKMGPFDWAGETNLYATQEQRPNLPAGVPLPAFPSVGPNDIVIWAFNGRKVHTHSTSLIGGNSVGAVDLAITGFDASFNPVALPSNPDDTLTLQIDNMPLTVADINSLKAFMADGTPATSTGTSTACPAFNVGPGGYVKLNVTVQDNNGHLYRYEVDPNYGAGSSGTTIPGLRGYSQLPATFPPSPYQAPDVSQNAFSGGTEEFTFYPTVDCCYDFRLRVGKRVTNGTNSPTLSTATFQTVTLKVTP